MRVELKMDGGFAAIPGLSKPITVDVDALPEKDRAEVRQLVDQARVFDLPAEVGKPKPGAADYRRYTLTVETDRGRHTVTLYDPIGDASIRALVDKVRQMRGGG